MATILGHFPLWWFILQLIQVIQYAVVLKFSNSLGDLVVLPLSCNNWNLKKETLV
uniref:Uncharacterized protein n=1 Tax=Nelumbo nucifera TaxID=4432 RepID=A0A822YPG5_NELNU|nr:TPA_asm: hypothetical protein HUJ06_010009 [Nelumbo nucifera]